MTRLRRYAPLAAIALLPLCALWIGMGKQATVPVLQPPRVNIMPWFYVPETQGAWWDSFNRAMNFIDKTTGKNVGWTQLTNKVWVRADKNPKVWAALAEWQARNPRCRILPALATSAWYRDDITDLAAWREMATAINTWPILKDAEWIFFDNEAAQPYNYLFEINDAELPWSQMAVVIQSLPRHVKFFIYPGPSGRAGTRTRERTEKWVRFWQDNFGSRCVIVDPIGFWSPYSVSDSSAVELRSTFGKIVNSKMMPMLYCDVQTGYSVHWQPSQLASTLRDPNSPLVPFDGVTVWCYDQQKDGYLNFSKGLLQSFAPLN